MTYGFLPDNWWIFDQELRARGITLTEIERVEMRPLTPEGSFAGLPTAMVTVTLRSGRTETWVHEHAASFRETMEFLLPYVRLELVIHTM
jgi:hypothetical protein